MAFRGLKAVSVKNGWQYLWQELPNGNHFVARFEHCPPPYAMETKSFGILGMVLWENSSGGLLFERPDQSPAAVREPTIRMRRGAGCSETL